MRWISLQLQVMNSPFNEKQVELLNQLLPITTEAQLIWLSGYLAAIPKTGLQETAAGVALADAPSGEVATQTVQQVATQEVTVLYGSQTGNGQELAEALSGKLTAKDFKVTLASMADFKPNALKKVQNLLLLVSTHGEGDPPDTAIPFHEFLHGNRAPKLDDLQFSVLSLGDSSYEFFCQTGKEFDERLEELGGKRLSPRVDCDLDFDEPAAEWFDSVISVLNEQQGGSSINVGDGGVAEGVAGDSAYSRTNPFQAEIYENLNLNGRGSNKETRHLELSLEGSNLHFEPGDSLGVYPENDSALVDALIAELGLNPDELIVISKQGEELKLRDALRNRFEITVLTKPLLEQVAKLIANEELEALLTKEREAELRTYIEGRDLLDLVKDFAPWNVTASDFITLLRKLPARLYSIASSLKANPDEVHLTIGAVNYEAHGRERKGVCSSYCAEQAKPGESLAVYVQRNDNFRLPANSDTPIIMIGPGTGIAPFRAFMEEREETEAEGKSWLFFGDQHYVTDFLYQTEWQQFLKNGVLTKLDLAFSRDTDQKVYVQHRMLEQSKELFQWLEEGAAVYICGDEKNMATDVHEALVTILEQEGSMTHEKAEAYLTNMQQQKRYQRDVY